MSQKFIDGSNLQRAVNYLKDGTIPIANQNFAPAYDATVAYKIGNLLTYLGKQYECIADATAGTLPTNTTYFAERSVSDVFDELEAKLKDGSLQVKEAEHAESAQSLDTEVGVEDHTPFAYQTSGGESDLETGIQKMIKLVGVDVVSNQQANFANKTNSFYTTTNNSITIIGHPSNIVGVIVEG